MRKVFYSFALALCALLLSVPVYGYEYSIRNHEQLREALRTGMIDTRGDGGGTYQLSASDILVLANDIIFNQVLDELNLNRDLLIVSNRAVPQYNIDLNGFTIQRNISNPVGDDGVSVFSFKERESSDPVTLSISDSKGGGKVIANVTTLFTAGNYPTAVLFPRDTPVGCTLILNGGSLIGQVNGSVFSGTAGVIDECGCTTIIYDGFLTAYASMITQTANSTLKLYGGVIGSSYNLQLPNQSAVLIQGKLSASSIWQAATIYGLAYTEPNAFSTLVPSSSKTLLNDAVSSISALNALTNEQKNTSKVEIYDEFDLTVNNVTVSTRNKNDVLGDGTVIFKGRCNNKSFGELHLKGATLSNITTSISDLKICLSGANVLNGDLIGYDSNVSIQSAIARTTGLTAVDKLTVTYAAETPVMLYDGDLTVGRAAALSIDGKNNTSAVDCGNFTLNDAWFDAVVTGAGPVVKSTDNSINSVLKSGSLTGKSVAYTPNLEMKNLYVLGHQLSAWDVGSDLTDDGISGKVHYYGGTLELTNAIIDARGKNVEAIKGEVNYITYKGTCLIISDSKAAIHLDGGNKTTFGSSGAGDNRLYIISDDSYAINAQGVKALQFGDTNQFDPITIYSGSTAINGNDNKPIVTVFNNMDISCASYGKPMYKVDLRTNASRVSDFGGGFDTANGVLTKANGANADHVVFRRMTSLSGTAYPIEVEGVSVTTGNADDVLGNGKVSYDAATNTLTLDNANVEGWYAPGIRVTGGGLNIALKGSSAVQSSNPSGAIYSVNGDLNISGGADDELFVFGRGMLGLNRMTKQYRTAITGGCTVSAICRDDNFLKSYRSAGMQSDSIYVNASTLYVENRSKNETNKMGLYSFNADGEPGLLLVDAEIKEGVPNTADDVLIAPTKSDDDGIADVRLDVDVTRKVLINGKIFILRNGEIYDTFGLRIK